MKLSQFDFNIPQSLIAQHGLANKLEARLLVVEKKTGKMEVKKIIHLLEYFGEKDVMVVNNAKVFYAKINGKKEKTGDKIEVFLQRELQSEQYLWDTTVEPARKIRIGNKLYFGKGEELVAEVVDNTHSRGRTIKFFWNKSYASFREKLNNLGILPLPAYIKRKADKNDELRYHSVFAKKEGSVISCGAGLHFNKTLVERLEIQGVRFAELTFFNSLAANDVIDVENLTKAKVDSDYYEIDAFNAKIINKGLEQSKKICAVDIMVMRALESSYNAEGILVPAQNWTHINIHPPFEFTIMNSLLTNFYQPKTYPFIATSAFAGYELTRAAYERAIKEKFRFLVYGDALLFI